MSLLRGQLAVYDGPGGSRLANWSGRATGTRFSTDRHGCLTLETSVRMGIQEAFGWYERTTGWVVLTIGGGAVWEGRIEDVTLLPNGIRVLAFGSWRALSDTRYTALWSTTEYGRWEVVTSEELPTHDPAGYAIDTNHRLYLAPQKGNEYHNERRAGLSIKLPHRARAQFATISFRYELITYPNAWIGALYKWDDESAGGGLVSVWSTNLPTSGNVSYTLTPTTQRLLFEIYFNSPTPTEYPDETGETYLKITDLRVKTCAGDVTASAIAADVLASVRETNPAQLLPVTGWIEEPGLDLMDASWEDARPAEVLEALTAYGDQLPFEAAVEIGRVLAFRPMGSRARTWYVDAATLEAQRTIEALANAAYGLYKDVLGRTRRTEMAADGGSASRYGWTRVDLVESDSTSEAASEAQRDAYLAEAAELTPRVEATFSRLFTPGGARANLWEVRAGDTLLLRNLPPTLSPEVERLRAMAVVRTEYDMDADELQVELEFALPTLEGYLLQALREG